MSKVAFKEILRFFVAPKEEILLNILESQRNISKVSGLLYLYLRILRRKKMKIYDTCIKLEFFSQV